MFRDFRTKYRIGWRGGTRRFLGGIPRGFNGNGLTYLLLDTFDDTRAAGAVNGTPATPGPGVREVTDSGNNLAIVGGEIKVTGTVTGYTDPRLYEGPYTRAFGLTLLVRIKKDGVASGNDSFAGWRTSTTGGSSFLCATAYIDAATINAWSGAGTGVLVGSGFAAATYYDFAIVLRTSGHYLFIKGGAFTIWTLLWQSAFVSTATLYASIQGTGAAANYFDNLRIPAPLYRVPVLAYDTFTRANGALGSTETAGPDAQAVTARAWTAQVGTWAIASNVAGATALAGGIAQATAPCVSADVLADIAFTRSAGAGGLTLRYADASNYLRATHDGTNCLLEQVVAGVATTLRTGVATYAAGAVIRVILSGTEGRLFYNDVAVGAVFTVPSSTATAHGLYTSNTGNTFDAFQILARGTGNEYGGLDAL